MSPSPPNNFQSSSPAFSDHAKEEVRTRISIADVVSRYVTLKPAGRNFKGLCPFHREKTPSFTVNPDRQIFHCFGCGKGGDVFTFLMEMDGVDFKDALKSLADEAGVTLAPPQKQSNPSGNNSAVSSLSKADLLQIHTAAAAYYYDQLRKSERAIEYFKSRKLSGEIAREFMLGFAPAGWSNLVEYGKKKKISPSALLACGLAIAKEGSSEPYDRFRDRIMFPLFDGSGRCIGFAGRTLDPDGTPKYLNSPETPLYLKGRYLYGLHKARPAIKEKGYVILVEGYMDFLGLYQAGIRNVLATSGTALTQDHGLILRRFCNRVVLMFDGDNAGVAAAQKAIVTLAPLNMDIRVLILPSDEDPDTFVLKSGAGKLTEMINLAPGFIGYSIEQAVARHGAKTPHAKSAVLDELAPIIESIPDNVIRTEFAKMVAERLDLKETTVYERIRASGNRLPDRHQPGVALAPSVNSQAFISTIEGNLLRLLITYPENIPLVREQLGPQTLTDDFSENVYCFIKKAYDENKFLDTLLDSTDDPAISSFFSFVLAGPSVAENAQEELVHTLKRIQKKKLQRQLTEIWQLLKQKPDNSNELLQKHKQLRNQLKEFDGIL